MPALFPEWSNTALYIALFAIAMAAIGLVVGLMLYVRTPYVTDQNVAIDQPVEFDHRHHARDDGIECLYCHPDAERSAFAGIPATDVCMGCHSQVWNTSPLLDPVRRSYYSGTPIAWRRVHALADFVYFNHAVHVRGGIDCQECHGEVENMARVYQVATLQMKFCLDCHRDPPVESVPSGRGISRLTTCTACHR